MALAKDRTSHGETSGGGTVPPVARLQFRYGKSAEPMVKSAVRTLELLELFDDLGRRATVTEISQMLGYPQSSTSVLLQTLTRCGYLDVDDEQRSFFPTARVALLGHRTNEGFVTSGPVLRFMNALSESTGEVVVLAAKFGVALKYVNVLQARSRHAPHIVLGSVRPLTESYGGLAILSMMSERDVQKMVMRIRSEADRPETVPSPRQVIERINEGRRQGYFLGVDPVVEGGAMLAVALPRHIAPGMSLIIGGPTARITGDHARIVAAISAASAEHLGEDLIKRR